MAFGARRARDPQTRPAKLAKLAKSNDPSIRELVAGNHAAPAASLRDLATDGTVAVGVAVATNPSTPGATLEQLAGSRAATIKAAAAANPSTPPGTLASLVRDRRTSDAVRLAVANNPSTPASALQSMITPSGGLTSVELQIRAAVARNPATPTTTRARLFAVEELRPTVLATQPTEPPSARITLARAWNVDGATLDLLACDHDADVRRAVAAAPRTTSELLNTLARDRDPRVAFVAQARTLTTERDLLKLAGGQDILVHEALIKNPSTPAQTRASLVRRVLPAAADDTLRAIARDKQTPPSVLAELAKHASSAVRHDVAANPVTSAETLAVLAADTSATVRRLAGAAPATPLADLVRLASDTEPSVRLAVATNTSTPAELLIRLAVDEASDVVLAVAKHASSTAAVLDRIVTNEFERKRAHPPQKFGVVATMRYPLGPLAEAAANPSTPVSALTACAQWTLQLLDDAPHYSDSRAGQAADILADDLSVADGLTKNPTVPEALLDSVAHAVHSSAWVRHSPDDGHTTLERVREQILTNIVKNPSASVATLRFLSRGDWVARETSSRSERDDGLTIRWIVWDERATAAADKDMARMVRSEIKLRQWRTAAAGADRLTFASSPDAPPEVLDELSGDQDATVRAAVAANPSTSPSAFQHLSKDVDATVRAAAARAEHPGSASDRFSLYTNFPEESYYQQAFEELTCDPEPSVRSALVSNSSVFWNELTEPSRSALALDADPVVQAAVIEAAATRSGNFSFFGFGLSQTALLHLIDVGGPNLWRALAGSHHDLPSGVVERLVATRDTETGVLLARSFHASQGILRTLARSDNPALVRAVASRDYHGPKEAKTKAAVTRELLQNALTPQEFVTGVARHTKDADELARAVASPAAPVSLLVEMAGATDGERLRAVAKCANPHVWQTLAKNPATPADVLAAIAVLGDPATREALLLHPSTPEHVLVGLIKAGVGDA